jgi:hypothetical protein
MKSKLQFSMLSLAAAAMTLVGTSNAASVRTDVGYTANTLARNDDQSTGQVGIGFSANFFGTTYTDLYVNNNGNVTFNGPLSTYTPFGLLATSTPIIAPFFADVDTRSGGLPVTYGASTVNGRTAFGVNWVDVGYYNQQSNPLNSFQLVMIDRSDTGAGNFDFEFNYDTIGWETGSASSSGGTNGLGGNSARAGYSNGSSASFEIAGSGVNGAFLDGGSNSLVSGGNAGRYVFQVRNGNVTQPPSVPDGGSTLASLGLALGALGLARRKFKKS